MMPGHIILTVAKYEAKTLLRSWFFRVFAFLTLGILILLNVALFATPFSQWMYRGMSASLPYTNILLLNIAQAIIAVFMASEFLKFDRKLDTAESVYSRSMTNTGYVIGKMLGVLAVFIGLNLAVLVVSFVFQFFFTEVGIVPSLYLYYPLLLSLPTLIFMFGLSFLVMAVVRNQAVTFLLLLGYVVAVIMFLGERLNGLADVIGLHVPLMYSDFIGFGTLGPVLMQRGMYLLLGIGCILATALLLPRLIQSRTVRTVTVALTAIFIAAGALLGGLYLKDFSDGKALRAGIWALNREMAKQPAVTLTACDLTVTHSGGKISADAALSFTNETDAPLDTWAFSLNPGFTVEKITRGGTGIPFERNLHLITVKAPEPLAPGASDAITITYRGTVNEDACYSDLGESERADVLRYWVYAVDRRYGIITPDYVLLTAEDLWYPVAGVPYGAAFPEIGKRDFVQFSLAVKTAKGLTAISQGAGAASGDGGFSFAPEHPLPQISLVIGKYARKSVTSEGVEYSVYYLPGHDYFSKYFNLIGKTIGATIDEALFDYETDISLSYPFPRLSIVETPIQFSSYSRLWKAGDETSQPEELLLPEKGVLLRAADFKMSAYSQQQRRQRSNSSQTPEEIQTGFLTSFIQRTFISSTSSMSRNMQRTVTNASRSGGPGGGPGGGRSGGGINRLARMAFTFGGLTVSTNYTLFPQFYSFVNHIDAPGCPLLDPAIENYLMSRSEGTSFSFRFFQGMTVEEEANALLGKMSLAEILADPAQSELAADALKNKASFLFTMLRNSTGTENFDTFFSDYLYANSFRDTKSDALSAAVRERFAIDLDPIITAWYTEKGAPAYLLSDVTCREVTVGDHSRYNVVFTITNSAKADGIVTASFVVESTQSGSGSGGRMSSGGGGMGMMMQMAATEENTKLISLRGGETKQVGMVFDAVPRRVTINTHVSLNLPASISRNFGTPEKGGELFEGERTLPAPPRTIEPGEIVVDDEDAGFRTVSGGKDFFLKRLLSGNGGDSTETYAAFRARNAPAVWTATIMDGFYGSYRRSARYIRSGDGQKRAIWAGQIPENGQYDVYFYCPSFQMMPGFGRGGGPRPSQQGGQQGSSQQQSAVEEFHFVVHHDDGATEAELDLKNHEEGWVLIGTYYFSSGPFEVEITDKTRGRVVFADAVKWVKRQNATEKPDSGEKGTEQ